jgi:hypothetical protein
MASTSNARDVRPRTALLAGLAAFAWSAGAAAQTLPTTTTTTPASPTLPAVPAGTPASPMTPAVPGAAEAMPVDGSLVSTTPSLPASLDPTVRPVVGERITYRAPNYPLLLGGLLTFGLTYAGSVVVAAEVNTHADNFLYIPVVGPWLDLANRPSCGGFLQPRCSTEGGRKAILAASGILQAAGVLAAVVGAFAWQRHAEIVTARSDRPAKSTATRVTVVPSPMGRDGYGVTALGEF